jgi:hypothetical protein
MKDALDNERVKLALSWPCKLVFIFISWLRKQVIVSIVQLIFQALEHE